MQAIRTNLFVHDHDGRYRVVRTAEDGARPLGLVGAFPVEAPTEAMTWEEFSAWELDLLAQGFTAENHGKADTLPLVEDVEAQEPGTPPAPSGLVGQSFKTGQLVGSNRPRRWVREQ